MFSIFKPKKRKISVNLSHFLRQDMHSHLLPGIDDGAQNVETSIDLIKGMMSCGIKQFVGTPHIMAEIHRNNRNSIETAYQKLKAELDVRNIYIDIKYAAEYMLDEGFKTHLEAGNMLTLFENMLLIETPFYSEPIDINETLFEIERHGYSAILAHPERYHYFDEKMKVYEKYLSRGMKLQLNILSISGYYGSQEKENAKKLLEAGMYSYIGTDLHHERHLARLSNITLDKKVIDLLERNDWHNYKISGSTS